MKVNTFYTTPEGDSHKVLMVDEINKMAYINISGTLHRWVHEPEYSTWKEVTNVYVPDGPAQMTDEQEESVGEKSIFDEDINSQSKTEENALQEPETSSLLQHPQEGFGETGSERGGVESSEQGNESPEESNENKSEEKKPKRKRTVKKKD